VVLWLKVKFAHAVFCFLILVILSGVNFNIIGTHWQVNFINQQHPEQYLLAVAKSDAVLRRTDPDVEFRFWYPSNQKYSSLFCSIASTRLWGYRLVNDQFPSLDNYQLSPTSEASVNLPTGTKIVILSGEENVLEKANSSLEQIGLNANLISTETIEQGHIKLIMTFIEITESVEE
jgi:hypothetical protein